MREVEVGYASLHKTRSNQGLCILKLMLNINKSEATILRWIRLQAKTQREGLMRLKQ